MAVRPVDELREQLRDRGYLTHGIERWFALDPWKSRAFWTELAVVAGKAGVICGLFGALPEVLIMISRNHPLTFGEVFVLLALYAATAFLAGFALVIALALVLKARPEVVIDTPRALLAISLGAGALLIAPAAVWWARFDASPRLPELIGGIGLDLAFFVMSTIAVSAALLSFSVYEVGRVPAVHRRSTAVPMTVAAMLLMTILFATAYSTEEKRAAEPQVQVIVNPTNTRIAWVAVDGLTYEIYRARPQLAASFETVSAASPIAAESTTERWASIGTGVPATIHGVRAIEGVRLRGGQHLLQSVSHADVLLLDVAERLGIARRQALPPTIRKRDYVWEIAAQRGIQADAVDWWTSDTVHFGALRSIGPESFFTSAQSDPPRLDELASRSLLTNIDRDQPRFAAIYLPALDVVLNRLSMDPASRLPASVRILDNVSSLIDELRKRGYQVVMTGMPGDRQPGSALIASTIRFSDAPRPLDVAPTLLALLGFPASAEMPGRVLAGTAANRIRSYGMRNVALAGPAPDREYYETLKSLGYIQ